jgi:hypothetical protein
MFCKSYVFITPTHVEQKTLEGLLSEAIQDNVGSLLQVQPHSKQLLKEHMLMRMGD